ncbi:MAG TPA: Holliday junction branch migration protein RuvA [Acidimicrobiales bacterium]|nr:Holliday junction branch migration protein RuvA [Acidimicrobiales bacterium]
MIGWLRGSVIARTAEGELLLDVGGVGYRVSVPPRLLATAGDPGADLALHVHTHVREDAIVLYGFVSTEERRCFEALLGAHGVGPALALSIVSVFSPDELVRAVTTEDLAALCAVPGVGRKTAARLVIDLRSKLAPGDDLPVVTALPGAAGEARSEVRAALAELGYGPDEIRRALQVAPPEGAVEEMLRAALRELAGAR